MLLSLITFIIIAAIIVGCIKLLSMSKPYADYFHNLRDSVNLSYPVQDYTVLSRSGVDNIINYQNYSRK